MRCSPPATADDPVSPFDGFGPSIAPEESRSELLQANLASSAPAGDWAFQSFHRLRLNEEPGDGLR